MKRDDVMALHIIWNDILQEKADAIVTPASRNPRIGTGLDKLVHQVAGSELLQARKQLGNIGPGKVAVSPSFGLEKKIGAKYVIHALGPTCIAKESSDVSDELILDGCYLRILCKAVELKCKTVSIPVLSSGKFGMKMETAVDVAVKAIQDFLLAFPNLTVKLVGIDEDFAIYAKKKYWQYFEATAFSKDAAANLRAKLGKRDYDAMLDAADALSLDETDRYFHEHVLKNVSKRGSFKTLFKDLWDDVKAKERAARRRSMNESGAEDSAFGEFLVNQDELAAATGISKRTIRYYCSEGKGAETTSRDKIFALAVAMKLSVNCTEALLAACDYRFTSSSRDTVIRDYIQRRRGTVDGLNHLLSEMRLGRLQVKDER